MTLTDGTLSTAMISQPGSKYFSSSSKSDILSKMGTAPLTDDDGVEMYEIEEQ